MKPRALLGIYILDHHLHGSSELTRMASPGQLGRGVPCLMHCAIILCVSGSFQAGQRVVRAPFGWSCSATILIVYAENCRLLRHHRSSPSWNQPCGASASHLDTSHTSAEVIMRRSSQPQQASRCNPDKISIVSLAMPVSRSHLVDCLVLAYTFNAKGGVRQKRRYLWKRQGSDDVLPNAGNVHAI